MTIKINYIIHIIVSLIATNTAAIAILEQCNRSRLRRSSTLAARQSCVCINKGFIIGIANLSYRIGFTQSLNSAVILNVTLCNICRNISSKSTASDRDTLNLVSSFIRTTGRTEMNTTSFDILNIKIART